MPDVVEKTLYELAETILGAPPPGTEPPSSLTVPARSSIDSSRRMPGPLVQRSATFPKTLVDHASPQRKRCTARQANRSAVPTP